MFVKYEFIPDKHKSVLIQLIRQKDYITEQLMARLYQACSDMLRAGKTTAAETVCSVLQSGDYALATATDERTGVYIQVAAGPKGPLMTVGQRWAMEGFDGSTHTIATKIWN